MRQQVAEDVGPQAVETGPGHPVDGPAVLGVGGEHGRAAQAVLPAHQQRIVAVGFQNDVGGGTRLKAHVAAQGGRVLHAHAVQDLGLLEHLRLNVLLHGGVAGVLLHVAQQDLLQALRVVEEIRFTLRRVGHLLQKRAVHVLAQPDGGNGHVVGQRLRAVSVMLSPSSEMPSVSSTMCL